MARPSKYTNKLASEIVRRIADGESLRSILSGDDMPDRKTFYNWIKTKDEFFHQYAQARDVAADIAFDEMQEIADNATPQNVQVAKLRVDTLKWRLARQSPRKYGDRQAIEHSGANGEKLDITLNIVGRGDA